jgi:pimeloyl-ACP methyl ester carboxylesterase
VNPTARTDALHNLRSRRRDGPGADRHSRSGELVRAESSASSDRNGVIQEPSDGGYCSEAVLLTNPLGAPTWLHGVVESQRIHLSDIETTVTVAGPVDGEPVVLLHGFPDDRHGWNRQIGPLAEAGFRVIAIDQRGCGEAGSGTSLDSYVPSRLVDDVEVALDRLEIPRAHVVGHDWGGVVAWTAAIEGRPWVDRLAIINAPHPAVFGRFLREHLSQRARSWYMLFLQVPWLPERLLGARNAALLARLIVASSTRSAFTPEEVERYRSIWSAPGRIGSMLAWYRAARRAPASRGRVSTPTLIVWGSRDVALDPRMADLSAERCDDVSLVRLARASHWPHRDQPEEVNRLLVDHLGSYETRGD